MHNRQVPRYVIKQIGKAKHNKAKERKATISKRCHNLSADAPRSQEIYANTTRPELNITQITKLVDDDKLN